MKGAAAVAEIEKLDREKFTVKADKVRVSSTLPLTEAQKAHLANVFKMKLGYAVSVEEEIEPEIISGFIIKMGEFIIDGSLKNKLNKTIPYLHTGLEKQIVNET